MTQIEDRKEWEQQEGEPNSKYYEFTFYRDLSTSERSLNNAYANYLLSDSKHKGTKSVTTRPGAWDAHSGEWNWVARAQAYDVYKADLRSKRRLEAELERMASIKDSTLELVDIVAKDQVEAMRGDDAAIRKIMEKALPLKMLMAGTGKFILDGYKAFHGDKKEINGTIRLGPADWNV